MNDCQVAKDLMPLYVEDLVSEESRAFVEEHMKKCSDCKRFYEQMKKDYAENAKDEPDAQQYDKLIVHFVKYQNWLKLSFAFVLTMAAVVFSMTPVPFLSTFFLLVAAPVASAFLYKKVWPLFIVNALSVAIAVLIPSETISEAVFFGILFMIILCLSTVAGHFLWRGIHRWKLNSRGKRVLSIGLPSLLLAGSMLINAGFTGNPVGYISAYFDISDYVKEEYKEEDLDIKGIYFYWYDSHYYAKVANGTEEFTINRYATGYVADNRHYDYSVNYGTHYEEIIEMALNQAAREQGFDSQYFWVTNATPSEDIVALNRMEVIIRFADSNEQYPEMTTLTTEDFLKLCRLTVDTLELYNIPYKTINFQANDVDGKEMYLDLENGITEESIYQY